MTQHITSEKARARWREILDAAVAGETIVIERYGRPVAVLKPFDSTAESKTRLKETAAPYDITSIEQLKAEIVAEVVAELGGPPLKPIDWHDGIDALSELIADDDPYAGLSTDEIVERLRVTRREIFEARYADLYR